MRARLVLEMALNPHGKFYADDELVDFILTETFKIVDINNVSEIIEPATGGGAFIPALDQISQQYGIPVKYMDLHIDKAVAHRIKKPQDFLTYIPEGKYFDPNRLIITGPPYGDWEENPASTKLARQFGTKAAEIAGYFSFIVPVSWLIDNYPAPKVKIIKSFDLKSRKFTGVGGKKHNIRTAVVICKSIDLEQWKKEKEQSQNFGQVEKDFKIRKWEKWRGDSPFGWDYFVNYWGKYDSGEVAKKTPVSSRTGNDFTAALAIKVINQDPNLRRKFDNWIKDFETNYKDEIKKHSLNTNNILPMPLFKRFLRDALYFQR